MADHLNILAPNVKSGAQALRAQFHQAQPFRFAVIDDFLEPQVAESILAEFPGIDPSWLDANGLHTKNKWTLPVPSGSMAARYFAAVSSNEFRSVLGEITGVDNLLEDPNLLGAGYHQILDGGFLNVHIDFNKLEGTNLDRRLNLILYLNKDWRESYGGYLELWDMATKTRVANIAPIFNRAVVFETNEVSFHGHPVPLNTQGAQTRKSLSVYYYTDGRSDFEAKTRHSTVYVNVEGSKGKAKLLFNGLRQLIGFGWLRRRFQDRKIRRALQKDGSPE
jgi:hypothetical protein